MKKNLLILAAATMFAANSHAQNMVSNGSFELYNFCPSYYSELYVCTDWAQGTHGTSDYFHICGTSLQAHVPNNANGYQQPSDGDAYSGIYVSVATIDYTEYLLGNLTPLIPGHSYQVSIKVSLSDTSAFGCNRIAALFMANGVWPDTSTQNSLGIQPQIDFQNYSTPIIDKTNWVTLTDTLLADSAYNYIMIGRFVDSSQVDTTQLLPPTVFNNGAFYYVDEISVTDLAGTTTSIGGRMGIDGLALSPNPMKEAARLSFSNPDNRAHTFYLFDIEGRMLIKHTKIRTGEITIERGQLNAGCYYYELKSEDGDTAKGKLFVQ